MSLTGLVKSQLRGSAAVPQNGKTGRTRADPIEAFILVFIVLLWGAGFIGRMFGFAEPGPVYDTITVLVVTFVSQYLTGGRIAAENDQRARNPPAEGRRTDRLEREIRQLQEHSDFDFQNQNRGRGRGAEASTKPERDRNQEGEQ